MAVKQLGEGSSRPASAFLKQRWWRPRLAAGHCVARTLAWCASYTRSCRLGSPPLRHGFLDGGLAAEPKPFRLVRAHRGISRGGHRIVTRQAPFRTIRVRSQAAFRQMPLQQFVFFAVFEADQILVCDGLLYRNLRPERFWRRLLGCAERCQGRTDMADQVGES